jgi:hypothetical protein
MCYRHNLTGPKDGPRATWAAGNHCNSLQIGFYANVPRARMAMLWQNRLNYSGSSALVIAMLSI